MPKEDRTGPLSEGAMTGGQLGRCAPDTDPEKTSQDERPLYGLGRGGLPRGRRRGFGLGGERKQRFPRR